MGKTVGKTAKLYVHYFYLLCSSTSVYKRRFLINGLRLSSESSLNFLTARNVNAVRQRMAKAMVRYCQAP